MPETREQLTFEAQSRGFMEVKQKMLDLSDAYQRFQQQGLAGLKPNELNLVGNAMLGMGAAGAAAFGLIARSSLQAAMYIERVEVAYSKLLGSRELAAGLVKEIRELAVHTPFQFEQLVGIAQRLLAFGVARKELHSMITDIGDLASAFGGTAEQLEGVTYAFGHVQAMGRLTGREVRLFVSNNIPIFDILHEKLGLTKKDMEAVALQGIDAGKALQAIREYSREHYGGMMQQIMKTGAGAASNFKDAIFELQIALGNVLLPTFTQGTREATAFAEKLAKLNPSLIRTAATVAGAAPLITGLIGALLKLSAYQAIYSMAVAQRAAQNTAANEAEAASAEQMGDAYRRANASASTPRAGGSGAIAAATWIGKLYAAILLLVATIMASRWAADKATDLEHRPSVGANIGYSATGPAAGAAAGAIIGTWIFPGIGTLIGAIGGAIIWAVSSGISAWFKGRKILAEGEKETAALKEYFTWRSKLNKEDQARVDAIRTQLMREQEMLPESQRMGWKEINAATVRQFAAEKSPQAQREMKKEQFDEWLKAQNSYIDLLTTQGAKPEEIAKEKSKLAAAQRSYAEWLRTQGEVAASFEQDAAAAKTEKEANLLVATAGIDNAKQKLALAQSEGKDTEATAKLTADLATAYRKRADLSRAMGDNKSATEDLIEANKLQTEAARMLAQRQQEWAQRAAQWAAEAVAGAQLRYASPEAIRQARYQQAQADAQKLLADAELQTIGKTQEQAAAIRALANVQAFNRAMEARRRADEEYLQAVLASAKRQGDLRQAYVGLYSGTPGEAGREAWASLGTEMATMQTSLAEGQKAWLEGNREKARELFAQGLQAATRFRNLQRAAGQERYQFQADLAETEIELAKRQGAGERLRVARQKLVNSLWGLADYLNSIGDVLGANRAAIRALDAAKGANDEVAARIIGGTLDERTRNALQRVGGGVLRGSGVLVRSEGKNRLVLEFTGAEAAAGKINEKVQVDLGKLMRGLGSGAAAAAGDL